MKGKGKRKAGARKKKPAARVAKAREKIEIQRRRASRPTLPVNSHAPVSKSLAEIKRSEDRKSRQRKDWDKE